MDAEVRDARHRVHERGRSRRAAARVSAAAALAEGLEEPERHVGVRRGAGGRAAAVRPRAAGEDPGPGPDRVGPLRDRPIHGSRLVPEDLQRAARVVRSPHAAPLRRGRLGVPRVRQRPRAHGPPRRLRRVLRRRHAGARLAGPAGDRARRLGSVRRRRAAAREAGARSQRDLVHADDGRLADRVARARRPRARRLLARRPRSEVRRGRGRRRRAPHDARGQGRDRRSRCWGGGAGAAA